MQKKSPNLVTLLACPVNKAFWTFKFWRQKFCCCWPRFFFLLVTVFAFFSFHSDRLVKVKFFKIQSIGYSYSGSVACILFFSKGSHLPGLFRRCSLINLDLDTNSAQTLKCQKTILCRKMASTSSKSSTRKQRSSRDIR